MENALVKSNCRFIQFGKFKSEITKMDELSDVVKLHCMNSAEYEHGVLHISLKRMLINNSLYDFFEYPEFKNSKGENLILFCPVIFIDYIDSLIKKLLSNKIQLKYIYSFKDFVNGLQNPYGVDFYWDILNDFCFFYGDDKKEIFKMAFSNMKGDFNLSEELLSYYLSLDVSKDALDFLNSKKKLLE